MAPSATSQVGDMIVTKRTKVVEKETPLQAISHGDVLPGIPKFPSYAKERRHMLVHMAAVLRNFARQGYNEGQSGHISVCDPEFPDMMWMNPLSRHFGMMRAGDMLLVDMRDGRIVAGNANPATGMRTANAAGVCIHRAVHRARPHNAQAVVHMHTDAGRAWAAFGKPLEMLTQDVCTFYKMHTVYKNYGGIVLAEEEGENIARALGPENKAAILMNHGLLTVGETVDEAGFLFSLLDHSCRIQLQVEAACANGLKKVLVSDEEATYNYRWASEPNVLYREFQPDVELEIEAAGGDAAMTRGLDQLTAQMPAQMA